MLFRCEQIVDYACKAFYRLLYDLYTYTAGGERERGSYILASLKPEESEMIRVSDFVCLCNCVCIRVREREREKSSANSEAWKGFVFLLALLTISGTVSISFVV